MAKMTSALIAFMITAAAAIGMSSNASAATSYLGLVQDQINASLQETGHPAVVTFNASYIDLENDFVSQPLSGLYILGPSAAANVQLAEFGPQFDTTSLDAKRLQMCYTGVWTQKYMAAQNVAMTAADWAMVDTTVDIVLSDADNQLLRDDYRTGVTSGDMTACSLMRTI
jgi:hypothetical protein